MEPGYQIARLSTQRGLTQAQLAEMAKRDAEAKAAMSASPPGPDPEAKT